jgi:dipeptidyl aminopeptidase/acylaminoacyl peptidase
MLTSVQEGTMRHPIMAALAGLVLLAAGGAQARPFTAKDMATLDRVGSPRISPDGHWLAYQVRSTDWAANKGVNAIWLLDLSQGDATSRKLEIGEGSAPRWAPDGRTLYFLSSRSKTSEIWRTDVSGVAPAQVTTSPVDVGAYRISPDGRTVVFAALAYPDCKTLICSADRHKARGENKAEGEVYNTLGVRFWDSFGDGRYQHLFAASVSSGEAVALQGDLASDTPSRPEGDESAFVIAPDGKSVIFAAHDPATAPGVDTRSILYIAPLDGSAVPHALFATAASDGDPAISPDGRTLAFIRRAGSSFGAARGAVMLADLKSGAVRELDKGYDRTPGHLDWSEDGKALYATVEDEGVGRLIRLDTATGGVTALTRVGHVGDFSAAGGKIVIAQDALDHPADMYLLAPNGRAQLQLTHANMAALADVPMGDSYEPFTFTGWNGERVHGYVVKPQGWKPGLKYPTAFLIHGGPHGSFGDSWSYRWNPQAWAGMGYAVVMVDFHGSSGYGEVFGQSIVGHWGDRPLEDLQKGWAAAQARYPWVDGSRACALGGSYGGYMVDWIAGNWNAPWKCLVDHDGILDTRLMAFATDIPGFSEDETGAWLKDPAAVERFNPINHLNAWSKPILVIHGGKDYRVPFDQGLGAFTAAQRKGVPSQFLYFGSENHWVLKPQNSVQWYDVVGKWMDRWIGDTAPLPIGK